MTNQAAQTMPELPVALASIHADGYWTTDDRRPDWKWPARQRVFSVDQMHQYARDYAAMLAAAPAASGVDTSTNEAWASRAFGDEHGGYRVCRCIDCGGDQPGHDPTCKWMNELHGEAAHHSACELGEVLELPAKWRREADQLRAINAEMDPDGKTFRYAEWLREENAAQAGALTQRTAGTTFRSTPDSTRSTSPTLPPGTRCG